MLRTSLESACVSPFCVKKLRRLSTPAEFNRKFVLTCVLPFILYCSPATFPGLLKHDFVLLKHSIKLISQVSGLSSSYLTNLHCERHIKASSDFAERIRGDHQHPHTMSYQRQGRTPPLEAVSSCIPRRLPELCPPVVITTPGRPKPRTEPVLTETVLNLYIIFCLPLLCYCPSFYHLKFVEEEAENFTFSVK